MASGSRVTIFDIARHANVSFKTVSRVLNENPRVAAELRERVVKAIAELGYRPNRAARALAGTRGYALAFLITTDSLLQSDDPDRSFPTFVADLQFWAFVACQEFGYQLVLETANVASPTLIEDLKRQLERTPVDGIIVAPPAADSPQLLDALDACGAAYIRLLPGIEPERAPSVAIDEYGGAFAMTRHLLSLGHHRIGFVTGPEAHVAARRRLVGYRDALAQHETPCEPMIVQGDFTFATGMAAAEMLLAGDTKPSAIFAANDDMAAGALAAAHRLGLHVPEQLSIAGFDDSTIARVTWPSLTTIRQPLATMTRAAVQHLVAVAGADNAAPHRGTIEIPFTLVQRGSAGPCPDEGAKPGH